MKKFKGFYWVILLPLSLLGFLTYQWYGLGRAIEDETDKVWPIITQKSENVESYKQRELNEVLPIVSGEYPPFIYTENGVVKGLSYEIFDAVMKAMGLQYNLEMTSWSRGLSLLESGEAFATFPYTQTELRGIQNTFTDPIHTATDSVENFYFYAGHLENKALPTSLEDLKNYKIGGVYGYYHLDWAMANNMNVDISVNEIEAFNKLKSGKIDTIALNSVVADYLIKTHYPEEETLFIKTNLTIESDSNGDCVMLSKRNQKAALFIEKFNQAYKILEQEGKIDAILKKYRVE